MKLFKNACLIVVLIATNSVVARPTGQAMSQPTSPSQEIPAPSKTPSQIPQGIPALPAKSFQYYLSLVRSMPSSQIINNEGVFTPTFENLVKSSELDPKLMEALFQAGRNLHMPLSGDNDADVEVVTYAQERIDGIMNSVSPKTPKTIDEYLQTSFAKLTLNQVDTKFINTLQQELRTTFNITDQTELLTAITNGLIKKFPNDTSARQMKITLIGNIIYGQKIQPPVPRPMEPKPQHIQTIINNVTDFVNKRMDSNRLSLYKARLKSKNIKHIASAIKDDFNTFATVFERDMQQNYEANKIDAYTTYINTFSAMLLDRLTSLDKEQNSGANIELLIDKEITLIEQKIKQKEALKFKKTPEVLNIIDKVTSFVNKRIDNKLKEYGLRFGKKALNDIKDEIRLDFIAFTKAFGKDMQNLYDQDKEDQYNAYIDTVSEVFIQRLEEFNKKHNSKINIAPLIENEIKILQAQIDKRNFH